MDFRAQLLANQGRAILEAEAENARAQDEAAAAQRAQELREQHAEQRRQQAEAAQQQQQQQHADNMATMQAQRTSNWFTMNATR